MNKVQPIKPNEVTFEIPDFIFKAVNALIKKHWDGKCARVTQDEIMDIVSSDDDADERPSRHTVFSNHWLDFEDHYRNAGWHVTYDKPLYFEDYDPYFLFEVPDKINYKQK